MTNVLTSLSLPDRWREMKQQQGPEMALVLILACAALLRFYALSAESLWFDEAYSVWVARHGVGWHIALSTQRISPPLYYLCLHFWLWLGTSEFVARSLSVMFGLGSIVAAYGLAKQLFDARVGLLSALLLAISPLHIWYSQEARMYILVAALGICSAYFMLLALRDGRLWQWSGYVLSTALVMNAHYFAVFLVPFQNAYVLYLILRRHVGRDLCRRWLLSQAIIGLLSVIGLAGMFSSESTYWWGLLDTWHGAPTITDLLGLMFSFSLGTTVRGPLIYWSGLFIFGSCVLGSLLTFRRGRLSLSVDRGLLFLMLYLVVPLGTIFLLSQFRSFWVLRYIFPFLPPYCIIVARGISRISRSAHGGTRKPGRVLAVLMLGAIVLISLWPVANIYRYEQKENWRAVVEHVTAEEQPGDLIFMVDEDIWLPFEHYYRGSMRRMGISRVVTERDLLAARVGTILPSYSRIWLVLSHTDNLALKDYLMTSRYTELVSERYFTGVEVDLFAIKFETAGRGLEDATPF